MAPQVLVDVDHTMAVMVEESFGPVIGIMKVRGRRAVSVRWCRSTYSVVAVAGALGRRGGAAYERFAVRPDRHHLDVGRGGRDRHRRPVRKALSV
jgi:hypothetical protein